MVVDVDKPVLRRAASARPAVIDATDDDPASWDALAVFSARGEALQSHAWLETKRATGWTPRRYRIEDGDGTVAVVALQERDLLAPVARRLPGPPSRSATLPALMGRLLYAPLGPILIRDDEASVRTALRGLRRIARIRRAALLVIDPMWEVDGSFAAVLDEEQFGPARRPVQISTTGMFVPLEADDAGQRARLNENVRRNLDRARKAGVEIVGYDAQSDPAELVGALERAYAMLAETGRRKGFGKRLRTAEHHIAGQRALIESGVATLWFARHEGREVAHSLVHRCGRRALLFQAAEGEVEQKRVPANFLLQWHIIRWAAGERFRDYDMGGVDDHEAPGLPRDETHPQWSLYRFKAQWGAKPVQFIGAREFAPSRLLGGSLRIAWRLSDAVRNARLR